MLRRSARRAGALRALDGEPQRRRPRHERRRRVFHRGNRGEGGRKRKPTYLWGRRARRNSGSRQRVGRRGGREARTARDGRKAKDEVPATTAFFCPRRIPRRTPLALPNSHPTMPANVATDPATIISSGNTDAPPVRCAAGRNGRGPAKSCVMSRREEITSGCRESFEAIRAVIGEPCLQAPISSK